MKKHFLLFLFLVSIANYAQESSLFKIFENGKVGYINSDGTVIIKPIYENGNDFSEGLAAVRINGYYGFIDKTGKFIVPPKYDLANDFNKGFAIVYTDSLPNVIDNKDKLYLKNIYKKIQIVNNTSAIITTYSKKQGLINFKTNKFILDTIYSSIEKQENGSYLVYKNLIDSKNQSKPALFDSLGNSITKFGEYYQIWRVADNHALVRFKNPKNELEKFDGIIDSKGNLLFKRKQEEHSYINGNFKNGLAKVLLCKNWLPIKKNENTYSKQYEGYINIKGEIVLNDTLNKFVSDFSDERAYTVKFDRTINFIDTKFKNINKEPINSLNPNLNLNNGYYSFSKNGAWGIMDKEGDYIVKPTFNQIMIISKTEKLFFYTNGKTGDSLRYGIADFNSKIILEPAISGYYIDDFINGILLCTINEQQTYLNKNGKIIYQIQNTDLNDLKKPNIDFMDNRLYYVSSQPPGTLISKSPTSKYYSSQQKINQKIQFESSKISVFINPKEKDTTLHNYSGLNIYIANATQDSINFKSIDSNLYLKLQAQNKKGEWKDIQYISNASCGNSYFNTTLHKLSYWKLVIPDYEGVFKTKIRAELKYIDSKNNNSETTIYSNIIDGQINPAQLWNNKDSYY